MGSLNQQVSQDNLVLRIAYGYAKRKAILVLIACREHRFRGISEKARYIGAKRVLIMAADDVKDDDCRRLVNETINYFGRVDHLVNTASLGHTFYFEEDINFRGTVYPTYVALLRQSNGQVTVNVAVESWLPLPRMSLYAAAKAALVSSYESLRLEVNGEIGTTIASHGGVGSELGRGEFMLEMEQRCDGNEKDK
ncbi:hypothetical protein SADUNF_Sadunf13G0079400 [Salix dunnii]|uniref:Uncharacterized protein n=1 Tax=Salix dunnii TaxID=1413687 RepID=A0A835ML25_9ROSI|nr:hypothetical protein SADUNF_Sadunf13G0079400 [Salix dunnii]